MIKKRIFEEAARLGIDDPPEKYFGFTTWSHMIPPFQPENTLIFSDNPYHIDALIRKVWGILLVIVRGNPDSTFPYKFDFVCVDLWDGDHASETIFTFEFAERLAGLCSRLLCISVAVRDMIRIQRNIQDHGPFQFERGDLVGGKVVLWWSVS